MRPSTRPLVAAAIWGGLIAGALDIGAVFAYWIVEAKVPPTGILQAIASSLMGSAAYTAGYLSVILGAILHFAVSFTFSAAYVMTAQGLPRLTRQPVIYGIAYGLIAYLVMSRIVVPLSLAEFGEETPTLKALSASLFIHLFLFGLPIALAARYFSAEKDRHREKLPSPNNG